MFKNLTPAQAAVLHLFESLIASLCITMVTGAIQYLSTNGLNIPGLLSVSASSFLGAVALFYKSLKSNPNTGQALIDTVGEIKMSPGLLPDISHLAQQLAPALAQELAKIKLPASQPQRQQQSVPQPLQASQNMIQPNNYLPGTATGPQPSYVQIPPAGQAFDLQSMQTRQMPVPGQQYGQGG